MPSFDVVSKVEMQEVLNAVDQTKREIATRYDFRTSKASLEVLEEVITVLADDKMKLTALQEILRQKLAKRGVSLRSVVFEDPQAAGGDMVRQLVKVKQGLSAEELKRLVKIIKDQKFKVTAAIQGDQLRVTGKKRDDLQEVIALLRRTVTDLELQFINFRE